ncbi:hypothetical protein CCACVL1_07000 [Corchorus capsularis]|uniref:Uncharacterized protein n=1 Tax=Corchorus capsularis TaxID=210143 RepID=A0A1R3JAH5_COCAP|nr:hypothetical protein CCACVL1_07000 [Corchorus capsularis]
MGKEDQTIYYSASNSKPFHYHLLEQFQPLGEKGGEIDEHKSEKMKGERGPHGSGDRARKSPRGEDLV